MITVAALGDIGGLSGLNASLTAIQSELPEGYNVFMDSEKFKSLLWMILPGLMYIMIGQDIYQRLFACKDHKTAIKASVCSAVLVCIVSVMPVTLGLIARVKHPELATAGTSAAAFATIAMSTLLVGLLALLLLRRFLLFFLQRTLACRQPHRTL